MKGLFFILTFLNLCAPAHANLSKEEAQRAAARLWGEYALHMRDQLKGDFNSNLVKIQGHQMRYALKIFGDKPEQGRSLFISLHGGGKTTKTRNDEQWENQKIMFVPSEGVYVAPRAPSDSWDMWSKNYIDKLILRLIQTLILFENIDPNKVYLMGYSAGGDGVFQLGTRMADKWAAASASAGHPNDASPLNLLNTPFMMHIGEADSKYDRNKAVPKWAEMLNALQQQPLGGYLNCMQIYQGFSHWMDGRDIQELNWLLKFKRDPLPTHIVWNAGEALIQTFYWLKLNLSATQTGLTIYAKREGQNIEVESSQRVELEILLNDNMLNLDEVVVVSSMGFVLFRGLVRRSAEHIKESIAMLGDPSQLFVGRVTVVIPGSQLPGLCLAKTLHDR